MQEVDTTKCRKRTLAERSQSVEKEGRTMYPGYQILEQLREENMVFQMSGRIYELYRHSIYLNLRQINTMRSLACYFI